MKKLIITLLSVGLLGAVGCGPPEEKPKDPYEEAKKQKKEREDAIKKIDEADATKQKKKEAVETYSDIAAQAYTDSVTGAVALQGAVEAFVTAAKAFTGAPDPSDPVQEAKLEDLALKLEAAQQAWRDSRVPYLQTEVLRFYDGPINSPNQDLEDAEDVDMETRINAWPLDESYIDYTCKYSGVPGTPEAPTAKYNWHCNPLAAVAPAPAINETTYKASIIGDTTKFPVLDKYATASAAEKLDLYKELRGANQNEDNTLAGQGYGEGDEECQEVNGEEQCQFISNQWKLVDDPATGKKIKIYIHHVTQGDANVSTGYHAIEFILWGQDFNPDGPGSRALTDFLPNADAGTFEPNAKRRLNYLLAVTDMLVKDLQWLQKQWATGGPYRTTFVNDPTASFKKIFNGMKNLSVDETGGERIQPAVRLQNQEEEHSCFSDNTQIDMQYDLQGILNVFDGTYAASAAADSITSGRTGVKEVLKLYVPLCNENAFKQLNGCKSGNVSVEKLQKKLESTRDQAKNLIDENAPGRKFFDQMVMKFWPMGSQTENEGHKILKQLADDLASLDDNYTAFSEVLNMEFTD